MYLKSAARALALVSLLGAANASVIDQSSPYGRVSLNVADTNWQQQITEGVDGKLAGIVLYASNSGPDLARISIGMGAPAFARSFDFISASQMVAAGGTYFDLSPANYLLTAGDIFTIKIDGGTLGCCHIAGSLGPYGGGHLYWMGSTDYGSYLTFQTYVEPSVPPSIPEPATLFLIGVGLVGLARKRKA